MRRTKEDAEQTRRSILASAMDIFYEKGYSKTTFDEIAKRINLTKGAVYWYFRNKPDIVAALINDFASCHIENIKQYLNCGEQISFDSIINMQLFVNKNIREDQQFYKFLFFITCQMEWSETIINKIETSIKETKQVTRNLFNEALNALQKRGDIKPDADINMVSEILMTMYAGMLEAYFTKRMENDFDEMVRTGFKMIFNNIKTKGEENEN